MDSPLVRQSRLSDDYTFAIDSDGNRVELDDPRVVHVWPIGTNTYISRLIGAFFKKRGWKFRINGTTTPEVLRYARELCSGRECLPCASITGSTYTDLIKNRGKDEISIYYNLDQDGSCQYGAWPVVWETFARRLNVKNVIYLAGLGMKNNYAGQGALFASELASAISVGDLLDEARNTLYCLAVDENSALKKFDDETDRIINSAEQGKMALAAAIKNWARIMSKIPLKCSLDRTPRVLLFGGLNVTFVHEPITRFFLERGIIAKVVDFGEGVTWLTSEPLIRYGFKRGILSPEKIFSIPSLVLSIVNPWNDRRAAFEALKSRVLLSGFDFYAKRYRNIMKKSGLLYDIAAPFYAILKEGSKIASLAGYTETPITVGRFVHSVNGGIFDGLVNIGCFNCQPAMNSQALLRSLSGTIDIPYAAIDCEGPWISANQHRLLDAVAIQSKRVRADKY